MRIAWCVALLPLAAACVSGEMVEVASDAPGANDGLVDAAPDAADWAADAPLDGAPAVDTTSTLIAPGADKSDEINDAIASASSLGGGTVQLMAGTYGLTTAIELRSGVILAGEGPATVLEGNLPAGDPDDPENAVVLIVGQLDPSRMDSDLSAEAAKNAPVITVTAPSAIGAGDYVYLEGHNTTSAYLDSEGPLVVRKEPVLVANVEGDLLALAAPLGQYHSAGVRVTALSPVIDAGVRDVTIVGTGPSVAVGILSKRAMGTVIRRVTGSGFSRSLVNLEGSKRFAVDAVSSTGEVNSIVTCDSSMHGSIDGVSSAPLGARHHALGIPRGLLTFRNRCSDIVIPSAHLEHGVVGVQVFGGENLIFGDVLVRDMVSDRATQTWQSVGEGGGTFPVAAGLTGGAAPLDFAEFSQNIVFGNVVLEDTKHPAQGLDGASAYLHDWINMRMQSLSVSNSGGAGAMAGVIASDVSGRIGSIILEGVDFGLRTHNAWAALDVDLFSFNAPDGLSGGHDGVALLGHAETGPLIRRFTFGNVSSTVRFSAGFADWAMRIERYHAEPLGEFGRVVLAYNNTSQSFAPGDVVELDPASPSGTRYLRTPEGPNTRNAVVASGAPRDPGTGPLFIDILPDSAPVMCSTGGVAVGDLLVASATSPRRAEVSTAPEPYTVLGRALTSKPAGAEGVVLVGSP